MPVSEAPSSAAVMPAWPAAASPMPLSADTTPFPVLEFWSCRPAMLLPPAASSPVLTVKPSTIRYSPSLDFYSLHITTELVPPRFGFSVFVPWQRDRWMVDYLRPNRSTIAGSRAGGAWSAASTAFQIASR